MYIISNVKEVQEKLLNEIKIYFNEQLDKMIVVIMWLNVIGILWNFQEITRQKNAENICQDQLQMI